MTLKSSEILQVNATVITGVLILLTISGTQLANETIPGKIAAGATLIIIVPFTLSAVMIAKLEIKRLKESLTEQLEKKLLRFGIISMIGGFLYLVLFVAVYVGYVIVR